MTAANSLNTPNATDTTSTSSIFAAIDIGTVTCRLLLAQVDASGIHEIERGYCITNLGEDVDATGILKPEAMERVRAAVADFQKRIAAAEEQYGSPAHVIAMATSASRDAKNAADFVAMLARQGITLTVIPGEREAALSFSGASSSWPGQNILVCDVGGGSTELVCGIAGEAPLYAHSFNVGCRRVTEKFLASDPPRPEELASARAWCIDELRPCFDELAARALKPERLVAVAGTATSVVSMHEQMVVYDTSRVHGYTITRQVLDTITERLASQTLEQRQQTIGLDPGRAPVITAGLIILQCIMDLGDFEAFTVSETDILHGIILDAAAALVH